MGKTGEKNIEVEIKFQPTEKQLESMLFGAEKLYDEKIRDIYYDFEDFRLIKEGVRLRFRYSKKTDRLETGFFELKIDLGSKADMEIEDRKEIKNYLIGVDEKLKSYFSSGKDLEELMADKKMIAYIDFETERKRYKKEEFTIDVDKLGFGFDVCEIELMVKNDKGEMEEARKRIKNFAQQYEFDVEKKVIPKGWEYLRRFNPKLYEEIYLKRKEGGELKNGFNKELKLK